ncbi:MAG: alpha-amylase family glycosyl hydrolase [Terrimicrobiaceae bacterium]|nr:alpha-amylase family glycosyl hydrolase [Terrimicrobiaceae bacterium]
MRCLLVCAALAGAACASEIEVATRPEGIELRFRFPGASGLAVFAALGGAGFEGSPIVPHERGVFGSTVFLPFSAELLVAASPEKTVLRRWAGTKWGPAEPFNLPIQREGDEVRLLLPAALAGEAPFSRLSAWAKDISANDGWGELAFSLDPGDPRGTGDIVLRGFADGRDGRWTRARRLGTDRSKIRIYQMLPRLFGNTNPARKPNGSILENGCGKFADLSAKAIGELQAMGFTHVWATGVLQQATATDYSKLGEPADDPDILKGLAGSPYAIKDYFDVCPDYAVEPQNRLREFREMAARLHEAGLRLIIDFVPNHVARSHASSVRPELSFGAADDRSKFFAANNNFFWLTPESQAFGSGPPLRLPTVTPDGQPASPTARAAGMPADGLFEPEREHGRVTGNNLVSWAPDYESWYETVKLNYGFDFTDPQKATRLYPHGASPGIPIPDTWHKMDEIIAYWQEMGVDGFRVDMAHLVPPEFWRWLIARSRARNSDVFFVAEAYNTDPNKVPSADPAISAAGDGDVMFDLLASGFDAVYDDATYDKLKDIYDGGAWAYDLDRIPRHPFVCDNSLRYAENHDEVRLAAHGHWGSLGADVGRPVSALLFGLSRGPVMLYHGQEVGEPAEGAEGFGAEDARTTIFDYWAMPEFQKWVNGGAYDGGGLSDAQKALREYYGRLLRLLDEPAFRDGLFIPLNPANIENPRYGRVGGETASGHWLYSFIRHHQPTGQTFIAAINLHPSETLRNIRVVMPPEALGLAAIEGTLADRLLHKAEAATWKDGALEIAEIPPLTALYLESPARP